MYSTIFNMNKYYHINQTMSNVKQLGKTKCYVTALDVPSTSTRSKGHVTGSSLFKLPLKLGNKCQKLKKKICWHLFLFIHGYKFENIIYVSHGTFLINFIG
jgi:hypothetical protein